MPKGQPMKKGLETRLIKTGLNHVFNFDIQGDGRYREVAVVKMVKNPDQTVQSVHYIDVVLLDAVDKGRLKALVTGMHADKYELWDLMSQTTLNNGKNALDYFHQLTRVVHGEGAINTQMGGGLANAGIEQTAIVGSEFTDPTSGALETQPVK